MSEKSKQNNIHEYLALSCILHSIALLLLTINNESFIFEKPTLNYISEQVQPLEQVIHETQLEKKPFNPLEVPLLEIPCVLYKPGGSGKNSSSSSAIAPDIKAFIDGTQETETIINESNSSKSFQSMSLPPNSSTEETVQKPPCLKNSLPAPELPSSPTLLTHSFVQPSTLEDQSPTDESKKFPQINELKIDKFDESFSPKAEDLSDGIRRRKLKLSDLFKNLSSLPVTTEPNNSLEEGQGAPAVIVQGDIRYHSFIKGLLEHINSTSASRNGSNIIKDLLAQGSIKQNLRISLTLEKSGKVADAQILISSGCKKLDTFWVKTAYDASPFAPLPGHFKRDIVRVELITQL